MSYMNVVHAMIRITDAPKNSPIAVFRCDPDRNCNTGDLNVVFASTVMTQQMIADNHPDLVGVYDGSMDLLEIERILRKNALRARAA